MELILKVQSIYSHIFGECTKNKKKINIPIILVGGFRNINQMNDALERGIDFISMESTIYRQTKILFKN